MNRTPTGDGARLPVYLAIRNLDTVVAGGGRPMLVTVVLAFGDPAEYDELVSLLNGGEAS